MSLRIAGKHMNIGETLTDRIEDRIASTVSKYFAGGFSGHVTIEKEGNNFSCDCMLHLDSGTILQAGGSAGDATASFEETADKIEKRLRRYKRKLKDHHAGADERKGNPAFYGVVETPSDEEMPEDYNPVIIAESTTTMNTQSVAQAVVQLDLTDNPVVVFKNAANGETNVVYRRADGNIGWVDPSRGN